LIMIMNQRSYGGKLFRPKPVIHEEENLLVLATCWGVGDNTNRVVEEISKYVNAAIGDVEVTSPFEYVTSLSKEANYLRVATLLANDLVFRGENRSEYNSGYEVLILLKSHEQVTWAHVGGPHLLLKKSQRPLVPVLTQFDLSTELSTPNVVLPPLPSRLLGMDSSCQIICGDVTLAKDDQLVLTSSSQLPSAFWLESQKAPVNLEKVTNWMSKDNPEMPFWIATVNF
jgi:hypothetical protein